MQQSNRPPRPSPFWSGAALGSLLLGLSACSGGGGVLAPGAVAEVQPAQLSGVAVDGLGQPVAGVRVDVAGQTVVTADDGAFAFSLDPGSLNLNLSLGGVGLLAQQVTLDDDLDLGALQVLSTVSGRASDSLGAPVAYAELEFDGPMQSQLHTGDGGEFTTQLAAGQYTLTPSWYGYAGQEIELEVALPLAAELGEVEVLEGVRGRFLDGLLQPITDAVVLLDTLPSIAAETEVDGSFAAQAPVGVHQLQLYQQGMLLSEQLIEVSGQGPVDLGIQQVLVQVSGRVLDQSLLPVVGAEIVVDTSPQTIVQTQDDGTFAVGLPLAQHQLCVRLNGIAVAQELLPVHEWGGQGTVTLPEMFVFPMADSDGDGLGDEFEFLGWTITVDELGLGELQQRLVVSSPQFADTDGDGLLDSEEFAHKTDPSRQDTDGDLLNDREEITSYLSHPNLVDTDGDAVPLDGSAVSHSQFFDGYEALFLKTSPVLDDTDGDGVRDHEEVVVGGTSARIADLPRIGIQVFGEPVVGFSGESVLEEEQITTSVQNDTSSSTSASEFNFKAGASLDTQVKAQGEYGFPGGFSASVEAEATLKASVATDYAYHSTQESANSLNNTVNTMQSSSTSFTSGLVEAAIEVRNDSNVTVEFSNLDILLFQISSNLSSQGLKPIGKLHEVDGPGGGTSSGLILGPQDSTTLLYSNDELDLLRVQKYMTNPTGLYFGVGDFSMRQLDSSGQPTIDYDIVAQDVIERTAMLMIDWGDGTQESFNLACNVERGVDGTPLGLAMADAVHLLGIDYKTAEGENGPFYDETQPSKQGIRMLSELGGVSNEEALVAGTTVYTAYWAVLGPEIINHEDNELIHFDEIRLKPGDSYLLQFVRDEDADQLTQQQEKVIGTSDLLPDSDGDGLSDYEEAVVGWDVVFDEAEGCYLSEVMVASLSYSTLSNPRFEDADGDQLYDADEKARALDPLRSDTDNDGLLDFMDNENDACTFGGAPSGGLVLDLRLDKETYLGTYFEDQSDAENHALLYGTPGVVDSLPLGNEGFVWGSNTAGLSKKALRFVNDSPLHHNSQSDFINVCSVSGGDAVLEIDRSSADAPQLDAELDGQGWSLSIRYRRTPSGAWPGGYKEGDNCEPLLYKNIQKTPTVLRLPGLFSLVDASTASSLMEPRFLFESQGGQALGTLVDNGYVHVVLTCEFSADSNSTTASLWVNGEFVADITFSGTMPNPSQAGQPEAESLWIGWYKYDPSQGEYGNWFDFGSGKHQEAPTIRSFDGDIDDLMIWDRPLTPIEIGNL